MVTHPALSDAKMASYKPQAGIAVRVMLVRLVAVTKSEQILRNHPVTGRFLIYRKNKNEFQTCV